MKFKLFNFRVDNARVFRRISMNLNTTVGQAACRLLCRCTQITLAACCIYWIVPIGTCESGERTCDCSCFKCTWSKLTSCTADKSYHSFIGRPWAALSLTTPLCGTILADWMPNRDSLVGWPGRRGKALKTGTVPAITGRMVSLAMCTTPYMLCRSSSITLQ